ncbi:LLM class flavin-dependent oxidoreductase [Streptomyces sp. NPDC049040]|uniref:LLM class flavin-dependent oxidoreductase n=1 Tax=Streptomyces sp. NPDC049040 TaxID=3365593 RepID=UPI003713EE57
MHLAVELPRGGPGAPAPEFETWAALARAAERGLFDFVLLTAGEGGATADRGGRCGPDPVTVLHALAAVTTRIGLAVAVPPPDAGRGSYELARGIAALDRLSGGRAGGPPWRFGDPAGPQGRPVAMGFGGTAEVLLAGRPPAGRRARVLSRVDLAADAAATPAAAREFADRLHAGVQSAAADGFVLRPDPAAAGRGLDAFVDRVVPLLQERGSLRTAYTGETLRDHLGLPRPVR